MEKLNSMSEKEWVKHVKSIVECLSVSEKGPPSQKRIHLLHYLTGIATNSAIATALVKQAVLTCLCKVVKDTSHIEVYVIFFSIFLNPSLKSWSIKWSCCMFVCVSQVIIHNSSGTVLMKLFKILYYMVVHLLFCFSIWRPCRISCMCSR